jgi:hypothetical protein
MEARPGMGMARNLPATVTVKSDQKTRLDITDQLRRHTWKRLCTSPVMRVSQLRINEVAMCGGSEFFRMTACEARTNRQSEECSCNIEEHVAN